MEVRVAKSAGFCFGVKRAVSLVYEEAEKNAGSVYTLGPIIHNEIVVEDLRARGVRIIDEEFRVPESGEVPPAGSTVVVRSHGISREMQERLEGRGYRVIDATCPFVGKIHDIVSKHSAAGRPVVIIGSPAHPEVIGIRGWVSGECAVVERPEDAQGLHFDRDVPLCVVSQTTFNFQKFEELVEIIKSLGYHVVVTNTICNATKERQGETLDLAADSDVMIVIGGRSSSNTRKLYDICKSQCRETYYIQTPEDLAHVHIPGIAKVGITAGASTPNTLIQEVSQHVRRTEL